MLISTVPPIFLHCRHYLYNRYAHFLHVFVYLTRSCGFVWVYFYPYEQVSWGFLIQCPVALSIFLLCFIFFLLQCVHHLFPLCVWTHSSFCSSFTNWVFWSGVMRANTVARNKTCNESIFKKRAQLENNWSHLDLTDHLCYRKENGAVV